MGTTFTSAANAGVQYALAPAAGNNAILLDATAPTATVALATPAAFNNLSLVGSSGNGTGVVTLIANFTNGTSQAIGTVGALDWFNNNPIAVNAQGRVDAAGYNNVGAGNPRIYELDLALPASATTTPIQSITMQWVGAAGNTHTALFGLSGGTGTIAAQDFSANPVSVTANSTLQLAAPVVNFGALSIGSNTLTVNGTVPGVSATPNFPSVTLTGNPTFSNDQTAFLPLGSISDGGTARTITKTGIGTLSLGTANNLVANTTFAVNGGTLLSTNAGSMGPSAIVNMGGGTFSLGVSQTIASLAANAGTAGAVRFNGNTLTLNGSNNTTFGGNLADGTAAGALIRAGTGTTTFVTPTTFASYNGSFTVSSGKVVATGPGALGNQTMTLTGGTLALAGIPAGTIGGFGGTGIGYTLNNNGTAPPTINNNVLALTTNVGNIANSVWRNAPVDITQNFNVSWTWQTTGGTGGAPADGFTFAVQNAGLNALGGAGGSLGISGPNIANSAGIGTSIFAGNGAGGRGFRPYVNGAAQGNYITPGNVNLITPNGQTGNPINYSLAYDATAQTVTVTLTDTTANTTFSTPIPLGATLQSIIGSPTAFLGFTGATGGNFATQNISNFNTSFPQAAQLTYTNNIVVPSGSPTIAVPVAAGASTINVGTLTMAGGTTLNIAPDTGSTANLNYGVTFGGTTLNGPATFNVANNGTGTGTLAFGVVGGAGSLTKAGAGTLLLSQPSTYSGGTTITAGTVRVTNTTGSATGTGAVAVNGGVLTGNGSVGGATAINSGGTVSPGVVVGQIGFGGGGSLNGGGHYLFEFNSTTPNPGTTNDFINGTGALAIGATAVSQFIIDIFGANPSGPGATGTVNYTIATFSGGITGFDPNAFAFSPTGWFVGTPTISQNGNNLILTFQPVPEPVHLLALCAGAATAAGWWRRRRAATVARTV